MKNPPLTPTELELVRSVFRLHPEVQTATLFGSRAKGTHSPRSDVYLAITGAVSALRAETIASELEELPLPYRFDVKLSIRFASSPCWNTSNASACKFTRPPEQLRPVTEDGSPKTVSKIPTQPARPRGW